MCRKWCLKLRAPVAINKAASARIILLNLAGGGAKAGDVFAGDGAASSCESVFALPGTRHSFCLSIYTLAHTPPSSRRSLAGCALLVQLFWSWYWKRDACFCVARWVFLCQYFLALQVDKKLRRTLKEVHTWKAVAAFQWGSAPFAINYFHTAVLIFYQAARCLGSWAARVFSPRRWFRFCECFYIWHSPVMRRAIDSPFAPSFGNLWPSFIKKMNFSPRACFFLWARVDGNSAESLVCKVTIERLFCATGR